jgi:hypothetical protein
MKTHRRLGITVSPPAFAGLEGFDPGCMENMHRFGNSLVQRWAILLFKRTGILHHYPLCMGLSPCPSRISAHYILRFVHGVTALNCGHEP